MPKFKKGDLLLAPGHNSNFYKIKVIETFISNCELRYRLLNQTIDTEYSFPVNDFEKSTQLQKWQLINRCDENIKCRVK
jgi:hypothetical protein